MCIPEERFEEDSMFVFWPRREYNSGFFFFIMAKKKSDRAATVYHTEPRNKTVVRPKGEPGEISDQYETELWSEVAPDTFAPDKPNQEIDQVMTTRTLTGKFGECLLVHDREKECIDQRQNDTEEQGPPEVCHAEAVHDL